MMNTSSMVREFRKLLRCRAGNAVVETAFVLPILAVLAAGTMEFGRAYSTKVELADVARTGVQVAVEYGGEEGNVSTQVETLLVGAGLIADPQSQNFDATSSRQATVNNYCSCPGGGQVSCDSTCGGNSLPRNYIEVTVSELFKPTVDVPLFSTPIMLTEAAVMRLE